MAERLPDWSARADADLARLVVFYAENASPTIAREIRDAIVAAAQLIATLPVKFRAGKRGTREYPLARLPYTLIYRSTARTLRIVRVLHQARDYFNL
jgi:plasmid stabilization system protein ParE